ncbi:MAG: acyl carrier protein [Pseudomonadota bacterium]
MTNAEIMPKVQNIFRDVLDNEELEIGAESNANNVEDWDSLAHINLVVAIEKEFKISFALGEIDSLKNVGEFVDLIKQKINP